MIIRPIVVQIRFSDRLVQSVQTAQDRNLIFVPAAAKPARKTPQYLCMSSSLSNKIRDLRRQQQLNQQQLAYALGISQTAYSKLERGETALTLTHVQKLALVFNCTLSALLE